MFKFVAVGLLAVGALGASYVAWSGGCSAPAAYGDSAPAAIEGEDCSSCPMEGTAAAISDTAANANSGVPSVFASGACASEAAVCPSEASDECAISEPQCDSSKDCDEPCGACEVPCETPCDSKAETPAESTPSD